MERQKLNIVLMNITADQGISGVNRYMETIRQGFAGREDIVVHTVLLLEKADFFFHQVDSFGECINAVIPLPVNISPIIKEIYWLKKYSTVVADLLTPFFDGKANLIWHTHCINLCALAMIMKERLGGRILTHLHCIPWKFCFEYAPVRFNTLFRQELNGEYTEFRKNPLEKMAYETSDKIVCVTDSSADYLTRTMGVPAEKIAVVYNGLEDLRESFTDNSDSAMPGILYVGRISREKGIIALLNALRKARQAGGSCPVYLAGAGKASLINEIREHYSDLDLHFLGRIPFDELKKNMLRVRWGLYPLSTSSAAMWLLKWLCLAFL